MASLLGTIVADFETQLATALAVGDTTATLQSATDDDSVALPAGRYFFTIDGDSASKEHISCTLSGTSLTAIKTVTRQGAETSGVARKHRVGATVTITNFAHIKQINDLLDGTTDFDSATPLKYDGDPTLSNDADIATKKYVDDVAIAGGADASTTTKGISKMSVAPASASNPIAVGDNDPRVPTTDENDALAGTSGSPSASNKYVTDDDTNGTGDVVRQSVVDAVNTDIFGNGNDGNVTISSGTTTLTRDMYYADLTIQTGGILDTNGFKVFVSGTLDCEGTGKIISNGVDGSVGANSPGSTGVASGGSGGAAAYTTGTLPVPKAGEDGGDGGNASGGPSAGSNGDNGTNQAKSLCGNDAVVGGNGGDDIASGGNGGAAGTETGTVTSLPHATIPAFNLFDLEAGTLTQHGVAPSSGGGAGGGSSNTNDGSGGAGGGSGSSAGVVWIAANVITTLNADAIGGNGGQGGNGDTASKGGVGGGGGGGNGGVIILIYKSSTTINTDVSGGTGGAIGSSGVQTNATAGSNGNAGTVYTITVS